MLNIDGVFRIGLDPQRVEVVLVRVQVRDREPEFREGLAIISRVVVGVARALELFSAGVLFFGALLHILHGTAVEVFSGQAEVLLGELRHAPLFEACVSLAADLPHPLGRCAKITSATWMLTMRPRCFCRLFPSQDDSYVAIPAEPAEVITC